MAGAELHCSPQQSVSWDILSQPDNMPKEGQTTSVNDDGDRGKASSLGDVHVPHHVIPFNPQQVPLRPHMKSLKTVRISLQEGPGFGSVQQYRHDAGFVDAQLSGE